MTDALEADIVIIGAGSAGCVLASRLTENPNLQVILLEAGGGTRGFLGDIPGMTMKYIGNPQTDWGHMAEPDPTLNSRSLMWSGGKMLGGGSSINGMVYIRGLQRDYNDWAACGCTGWSWADVVPYFQKAEGFESDDLTSLGKTGPLSISRIRTLHPLSAKFVEACTQLQINYLEDYNQGTGEGAFFNLATQRRGQRASTAKTYLRTAAKRPNLRVIQGALADKILFTGNRATGVRFLTPNGPQEIKVRREVIVSGGTLQSPAVLMRSGIGPAAALREHNIEVLTDAPGVGENLQDTPETPFWGPNDLVFDAYGGFWFTDFGRDRGRIRQRGGVYYAKADGSAITEAITPLDGANGIGLSPDGTTLYVAETYSSHLWQFRLSAPGTVDRAAGHFPHGGSILGRAGPGQFLDSLAVDSAGNICCASPGLGHILVFSPAGGPPQTIAMPDFLTTNIAFGGPDRRTAFITLGSSGRLVSLPWPRPGLRLHHG